MPKAASLADDLQERYGVESELIRGSNGVFEVTVDESLVFSKKDLGRFPQHDEIYELIDKRTQVEG